MVIPLKNFCCCCFLVPSRAVEASYFLWSLTYVWFQTKHISSKNPHIKIVHCILMLSVPQYVICLGFAVAFFVVVALLWIKKLTNGCLRTRSTCSGFVTQEGIKARMVISANRTSHPIGGFHFFCLHNFNRQSYPFKWHKPFVPMRFRLSGHTVCQFETISFPISLQLGGVSCCFAASLPSFDLQHHLQHSLLSHQKSQPMHRGTWCVCLLGNSRACNLTVWEHWGTVVYLWLKFSSVTRILALPGPAGSENPGKSPGHSRHQEQWEEKHFISRLHLFNPYLV